MLVWCFIEVPELPHEVVDQKRAVSIDRYLVEEGQIIERGTPIAIVETWWAVLQVETAIRCQIEKRLFDNPSLRGGYIGIGQPLALAILDPEESPNGGRTSTVTVVKVKKVKPRKHAPEA